LGLEAALQVTFILGLFVRGVAEIWSSTLIAVLYTDFLTKVRRDEVLFVAFLMDDINDVGGAYQQDGLALLRHHVVG